MTEGLRQGDPAALGPFRLHGRLAAHDAGVVFLGYDPAGRPAALGVLHSAAAADAAARDRLVGALDAMAARHPDQVLLAGPRDPMPWVATAYVGGRPDHALALLDAVALTGPGPGPFTETGRATGPDFAPYWAGSQAAGSVVPPFDASRPPPVVAPADSRRSLAVLAACVVAAVAVVVGGAFAVRAWLGADPEGGTTAGETPGNGESTSPRPPDPGPVDPGGTEPPGSPGAEPSPTASQPVPDGPDGPVKGPTYGEGEQTFLMDLDGFPFDFRAPKTWGCVRSGNPGPGAVRWVCVDDSYAFSGKPGVPPGGIIEVKRCPSACSPTQWTRIRDELPDIDANWQRTDATTTYAEWAVGAGESARVSVAMSHVFGTKSTGSRDTHVAVRLAGPPSETKTLQKIVNEIRAQTP